MQLKVMTPRQKALFLAKGVIFVEVPGMDGSFQILEGHAPIVAILKKGLIKLRLGASSEVEKKTSLVNETPDGFTIEILSGFLENKSNTLTLLVDTVS